jgi:hypothetical protein
MVPIMRMKTKISRAAAAIWPIVALVKVAHRARR